MQHPNSQNKADVRGLGKVVDKSACTLMVLDTEKRLPLTRAWCLYEMAITIKSFEKHKKKEIPLGKGSKRTVSLKPNHIFHCRMVIQYAMQCNANTYIVLYYRLHNSSSFRYVTVLIIIIQGKYSRNGEFFPANEAELKASLNVDASKAEATFPEDLTMIRKLTEKIKTESYGQGFTAVNKMAKMALANLLSYEQL